MYLLCDGIETNTSSTSRKGDLVFFDHICIIVLHNNAVVGSRLTINVILTNVQSFMPHVLYATYTTNRGLHHSIVDNSMDTIILIV